MMLRSLNRYSDWGLLFLRLVVAVIFLYHGTQKFGLWSNAPAGMSANMLLIFRILSIAEPLGGAALIVGFLSRLASLGLAIIMVGAITIKITMMQLTFASATGTGWEFDLLILASVVTLMLVGPGKLSIDEKGGM